jgi:hypothetical protein
MRWSGYRISARFRFQSVARGTGKTRIKFAIVPFCVHTCQARLALHFIRGFKTAQPPATTLWTLVDILYLFVTFPFLLSLEVQRASTYTVLAADTQFFRLESIEIV